MVLFFVVKPNEHFLYKYTSSVPVLNKDLVIVYSIATYIQIFDNQLENTNVLLLFSLIIIID